MKSFFDYERPELAEVFQPGFRATQIFKSVYQLWLDDFELMTDLPKLLRSSLSEEWNVKLSSVHRRFDSVVGTPPRPVLFPYTTLFRSGRRRPAASPRRSPGTAVRP